MEFNLGMRDLAMAEVHLEHLSREVQNVVDDATTTIGKMKIELDSIKQPSMLTMKKINEFSENFNSQVVGVLKAGIDQKKVEILKTEQDHSNYDEAMASARNIANEDLKAASKQFQKSAPKVIL